MCVCVCLSVTIIGIGHTLVKIKNVKSDFVDFDICHRMTLLRKLFSMTLTQFLKVKDSNLDISTVASKHSGVICASKDSNRYLPTVASNHSSATCTSRGSNRDLSKVVNAYCCVKCKMITKLFIQICIKLVRHPPSSCSCL